MKKLLLSFVLLSFMFMGCSNEDNSNEPELTAFDEIMIARGYEDYSLTNDEFLEVYATLAKYTYDEDFYQYPKSKEIFAGFIDGYDFKYGVSSEMEEYKEHLEEYYGTDGTVQDLLNNVLKHQDNEQYIQLKDKEILLYKQDNQYIIESVEPFVQLIIDTDEELIIYEDDALVNYEINVLYLLQGGMNTEDVYLYKDETTLSYVYDSTSQTLVRMYNLMDQSEYIMNAHYTEEGKYLFGVTDFNESASIEVMAFEGTPSELIDFALNDDNVVAVLSGADIYKEFLTSVQAVFSDSDVIIYD